MEGGVDASDGLGRRRSTDGAYANPFEEEVDYPDTPEGLILRRYSTPGLRRNNTDTPQ
jgi:hypothetical protein